jgi:hypothetical protein
MSPNAGIGVGGCGVSANEYSCAQEAQINYGDINPYWKVHKHDIFLIFLFNPIFFFAETETNGPKGL